MKINKTNKIMYYRPSTKNNLLYIPDWCISDTDVDILLHKEIIIENGIKYHVFDNLDYTSYKNKLKKSYFACRWYPILIKNNIPTISSILIKSNILDLREDLNDYYSNMKSKSDKFIRLCGSSPKDIVDIPIFSNYKTATNALMNSQRTQNIIKNYNHCHLFIRDVVNINIECRCFIHDYKLRAVSVYSYIELEKRNEYEEMINEFCIIYKNVLPYNSCVMELGIDIDFPYIIEFNSFGIDGFADASLFNWDTEYNILYHSQEPEFRYPSKYTW